MSRRLLSSRSGHTLVNFFCSCITSLFIRNKYTIFGNGCYLYLLTLPKLYLSKPPKEIEVESLPATNNFVFHGSLQLARELESKRPDLKPGVWAEKPAFSCTQYYPALGKYLLNSPYVFLPVAELQRLKWEVYRWFGRDTKIFIRPDAGDKRFTGQVLDLHDFDRFLGKRTPMRSEARRFGNCDRTADPPGRVAIRRYQKPRLSPSPLTSSKATGLTFPAPRLQPPDSAGKYFPAVTTQTQFSRLT